MKSARYRTAFITSGDNEYVNTARFLQGRGFDVVWDVKALRRRICSPGAAKIGT
jgi:hypothetical protein